MFNKIKNIKNIKDIIIKNIKDIIIIYIMYADRTAPETEKKTFH